MSQKTGVGAFELSVLEVEFLQAMANCTLEWEQMPQPIWNNLKYKTLVKTKLVYQDSMKLAFFAQLNTWWKQLLHADVIVTFQIIWDHKPLTVEKYSLIKIFRQQILSHKVNFQISMFKVQEKKYRWVITWYNKRPNGPASLTCNSRLFANTFYNS